MNKSGLVPVEYKVLIVPEEIETISEGGIYLPEKATSREKQAQVRGKLIAIGGNAFSDWEPPKPNVGDTVYFAKYAGYVAIGSDGKEIRIANDKDITAIVKGESNE